MSIEKLVEAARSAQERVGAGHRVSTQVDWEISVRAVLWALWEPTPEALSVGDAVVMASYPADEREVWQAMLGTYLKDQNND